MFNRQQNTMSLGSDVGVTGHLSLPADVLEVKNPHTVHSFRSFGSTLAL